MAGNRAEYSWGIDKTVLWLRDEGTESRSLTNDLNNCLVEIAGELPPERKLTDYRIVYRDSEGTWDGVSVTKMGDLEFDRQWVEKKGGSFHSMNLQTEIFSLNKQDYQQAREAILASDHYWHRADEQSVGDQVARANRFLKRDDGQGRGR